MQTPADVIAPSLWYLRIVAPGLIPNAVYNMSAAALRATGDARSPLAVLIFTTLSNIALDLLFVAAMLTALAVCAFLFLPTVLAMRTGRGSALDWALIKNELLGSPLSVPRPRPLCASSSAHSSH